MQITISGKNLKLTKVLKDYANEKIGKLDKYLANFDPVKIDVELHPSGKGKGQPRFTVEITIIIPDAVLRCEETASDMYEAIDLAQDRIEKKLRRLKDKLQDKKRRVDKDGISSFASPDTKQLKKMIKKRKSFELGAPIHESDAISRMELLGHDFYVFIDKGTGLQSTVYRRKEGGYGIIHGK